MLLDVFQTGSQTQGALYMCMCVSQCLLVKFHCQSKSCRHNTNITYCLTSFPVWIQTAWLSRVAINECASHNFIVSVLVLCFCFFYMFLCVNSENQIHIWKRSYLCSQWHGFCVSLAGDLLVVYCMHSCLSKFLIILWLSYILYLLFKSMRSVRFLKEVFFY